MFLKKSKFDNSKKFDFEFDTLQQRAPIIIPEAAEEENGVRRYRSDNLQSIAIGNINGLTKDEDCKICIHRSLAFDTSINKIMANISDGVILISPAMIHGKK